MNALRIHDTTYEMPELQRRINLLELKDFKKYFPNHNTVYDALGIQRGHHTQVRNSQLGPRISEAIRVRLNKYREAQARKLKVEITWGDSVVKQSIDGQDDVSKVTNMLNLVYEEPEPMSEEEFKRLYLGHFEPDPLNLEDRFRFALDEVTDRILEDESAPSGFKTSHDLEAAVHEELGMEPVLTRKMERDLLRSLRMIRHHDGIAQRNAEKKDGPRGMGHIVDRVIEESHSRNYQYTRAEFIGLLVSQVNQGGAPGNVLQQLHSKVSDAAYQKYLDARLAASNVQDITAEEREEREFRKQIEAHVEKVMSELSAIQLLSPESVRGYIASRWGGETVNWQSEFCRDTLHKYYRVYRRRHEAGEADE